MAITEIELLEQPQLTHPFMGHIRRSIHAGKIQISNSALLHWLQFPKGRIRDIYFDEATSMGTITIILEDEEMPKIEEGESIPVITPRYVTTYSAGAIVSIDRIKEKYAT